MHYTDGFSPCGFFAETSEFDVWTDARTTGSFEVCGVVVARESVDEEGDDDDDDENHEEIDMMVLVPLAVWYLLQQRCVGVCLKRAVRHSLQVGGGSSSTRL